MAKGKDNGITILLGLKDYELNGSTLFSVKNLQRVLGRR